MFAWIPQDVSILPWRSRRKTYAKGLGSLAPDMLQKKHRFERNLMLEPFSGGPASSHE
jgi:hypothetical protein